jgi:hypothetical protein
MIQEKGTGDGRNKKFAAAGAIFLAFIVGLEIVIMISPFAFFFYGEPSQLQCSKLLYSRSDRGNY